MAKQPSGPQDGDVLPIGAIEFDQKNARRRTERSSYMIKESLQQFGPLRSLVGQRLADGRIIVRAGNGTLEEAGQIGIDKIRVVERKADELVVVVADDLDETAWTKYAIADNRSSDMSDWDADVVTETHNEVDLSDWFFESELAEFAAPDMAIESGDIEDGRSLLQKGGTTVKPVIAVEDIGIIERALQCTGNAYRGGALLDICNYYLERNSFGDPER